MTPVHIRWMIRRDMPEVLAIEAAIFTPATAWGEEDFIWFLRQRNVIAMIAELKIVGSGPAPVVGFMVYELQPDGLELLNFAVTPGRRREGIGQQMVAKLVSKLSAQRRGRLHVLLRESNVGAQLFFRRQGMRCVEVLHHFYDSAEDTGEDAYRLVRLADGLDPDDVIAGVPVNRIAMFERER